MRGDQGNVGIIRSPVRALILPDHLPALAIDGLVKMPRRALERGDDVADVNLLAHAGQGNRVKGLCGEEAFEEVVVPSCGFSFEAQ